MSKRGRKKSILRQGIDIALDYFLSSIWMDDERYIFNVSDFLPELEKRISLNKDDICTYDLARTKLGDKVRSALNARSFYSTGGGDYVSLDRCTPYDLGVIIKTKENQISGRKEAQKRLRERSDGSAILIFGEKNEVTGWEFSMTAEEYEEYKQRHKIVI